MTSLMSISQEQTMSSLEFMAIVNKSRIDAGETPHEPRKFLAKVENELDDLTGKKFRLNNNQTETAYYDLTRDQCLLVGMRESKAVRRNVLLKLKEKQRPQIPQTMAEALQLAADQARQLELAAPKVSYYDKVVERDTLLNATQVGQKIGLSAVKLNRHLDDLDVYNKSVKRGRAFRQSFVDAGHGIMRQTETGHAQPMITLTGEAWIIEKLTSEGII